MTKKKYHIGVFLLSILFFSIFMGSYFAYNIHFRGMTITNVGKIQEDYPQYMVNVNDEFIDYMLEFENMLSEPQRVYSEEELENISANLDKQNSLIINLQKNPPNVDNKDYLEIYKDYLKLYAFYIQGEVMRVEYISAYKNEYTPEEIQNNLIANEETYVLGIELCNMMGTMILENPIIVNKIHNTNAASKHEVIPLDEWQEEVSQKLEEYENSLQGDASNTVTNNTSNKSELNPTENDSSINDNIIEETVETVESINESSEIVENSINYSDLTVDNS